MDKVKTVCTAEAMQAEIKVGPPKEVIMLKIRYPAGAVLPNWPRSPGLSEAELRRIPF